MGRRTLILRVMGLLLLEAGCDRGDHRVAAVVALCFLGALDVDAVWRGLLLAADNGEDARLGRLLSPLPR
jgi:hypothetical protein